MKKLLIFILLFSISAQASCDWKTGITPGPNDTFIYSGVCHRAVGDLVQANKDLTAAIQLKDLAIQMSDSRIILWEKTAGDEQDRLAKMSSASNTNQWLFFGLGAVTVVLSGFMTARLIGH